MPNPELLTYQESNNSVVTYNFRQDGQLIQLAKANLQLYGLEICKEINRIPYADLVFLDGSIPKQNFELSNETFLEPGKPLEIFMGYSSQEELLFKGLITGMRVNVDNGGTFLEVRCHDRAHLMTQRRHNRLFENQSDAQIAETIIRQYGLDVELAPIDYTHPQMVQVDTSDWDFLQLRMEANGMLVHVEDGRVMCRKPVFPTITDNLISLTLGSNVIRFSGELESRLQFGTVQAHTWDMNAQQAILSAGEEPSQELQEHGNLPGRSIAAANLPAPVSLRHGGSLTSQELAAWADGHLLRDRLARTQGSIQIFGEPKLTVGEVIMLKGFGNRMNGPIYISGIRHELHEGSWTTDVQFGLPMDRFAETHPIAAPQAAGLLGPVHGLQIGVVSQITADPAGGQRIKVRLPLLTEEGAGVWARLATLDAGAGRGTVYLPEVNDEVVVGFLQDDPRHAVILGMLHSTNRPAPFPASETNETKGYISREGLHLSFQEIEKAIRLATPAQNSLMISDQEQGLVLRDQHGNEIRMDQNGIHLRSVKGIHMQAVEDVTVTANRKIKVQGSSASVIARALMEIKGKPVNIN